jgi:hypothetical protein
VSELFFRNWHLQSVIVALFLLPTGCSDEDTGKTTKAKHHISLYELKLNSDQFQGMTVSVIGVAIPADLQPGVLSLFASKDDARYLVYPNSVWVDLEGRDGVDGNSLDDVFGKFVIVEGTVAADGDGVKISKVTRLRVLSPLPLDNSRYNDVLETDR